MIVRCKMNGCSTWWLWCLGIGYLRLNPFTARGCFEGRWMSRRFWKTANGPAQPRIVKGGRS